MRNASTQLAGKTSLSELVIALNYAYNFSAKKKKNTSNETSSYIQENKKSATLVKTKFNNQILEAEPQKMVSIVFDSITKSKIKLTPNLEKYIQDKKLVLNNKVSETKTNNKDSLKLALTSFKKELEELDKKWSDYLIFDKQYDKIVTQGYLKF